jgi:hypothetical protein
MNLFEEQQKEFSKVMDNKLENGDFSTGKSPKKAGIKGNQPAQDDDTQISKAVMEKSNKALKDEVLQLLEDDRRLRNIRFTEVYNLIDQNKNMQTELISQQFESQKALMKAVVKRETAERMLADEELQTQIKLQISQAKKELQSMPELEDIKVSLEACNGKIDKSFDALQLKQKNA